MEHENRIDGYTTIKFQIDVAAKKLISQMMVSNKEMETQLEEGIKEIATKFFYHWYNAKGNNTSQGFDEWFKTFKTCLYEN